MIIQCNCTSQKYYATDAETAAAFQDETYGKGNRVANVAGKPGSLIARCTICKAEQAVKGASDEGKKKA